MVAGRILYNLTWTADENVDSPAARYLASAGPRIQVKSEPDSRRSISRSRSSAPSGSTNRAFTQQPKQRGDVHRLHGNLRVFPTRGDPSAALVRPNPLDSILLAGVVK